MFYKSLFGKHFVVVNIFDVVRINVFSICFTNDPFHFNAEGTWLAAVVN